MPPADLTALLRDVEDLARAIEAEAAATLGRWQGWIADPAYAPSAANFARYLALRHHDLRDLQRRLMVTLPFEAADDPAFVRRLAGLGVEAVRINCARGDLAVEIGFARLAEIQEEILWLGEAAQVPVIWATQVLESWVKTGLPSRGEMTDAAMAARAECIMLNKGPFLFEAIAELDRLMTRTKGHIGKKSHRLRPLTSW